MKPPSPLPLGERPERRCAAPRQPPASAAPCRNPAASAASRGPGSIRSGPITSAAAPSGPIRPRGRLGGEGRGRLGLCRRRAPSGASPGPPEGQPRDRGPPGTSRQSTWCVAWPGRRGVHVSGLQTAPSTYRGRRSDGAEDPRDEDEARLRRRPRPPVRPGPEYDAPSACTVDADHAQAAVPAQGRARRSVRRRSSSVDVRGVDARRAPRRARVSRERARATARAAPASCRRRSRRSPPSWRAR